MAEPLAITGLIIALVQGGFELYAGLSEYLDAVDARSEELHFARRQALDMRRSLEIIEQLAPKLASKHAASSSSLQSFLRSCEVDIKALNDLLLELTGSGPSGEGLRNRLHRVQVRAKRFTFPFSRPKIDRLEKRLAIANGSLLTALNTANLEVSLVTQDQVSDIHHLLTTMFGANMIDARIASSTRALSYQSRSQIAPDVNLPRMTEVFMRDTLIMAQLFGDRGALLQLVSKPGYLKSTIDESLAYNQQSLHNSWPLSDPICSCRPRRKFTRQRQIWSSFALSSERSSSAAHNPGCQFAGLTGSRQTFGVTLEYTALRKLFRKAIRLSFHMTFGAGGLSVNPGIGYVPLVDHNSAPAFRLIDIPEFGFNIENKDIGTRTLMCVKKLIACGVPAMAHDDKGQSAAIVYLRELRMGDMGSMLALSLISADPDSILFSKLPAIEPARHTRGRAVFPQWPALEEAAGYGPLCSATASGNQADMSAILATTTSALRECNIFGQGPLHLAVQHPCCLRLLIEASGADESILNALDALSRSPIEYATSRMGPESLESVEILLEADCAVWKSEHLWFKTSDDSWGPIIEAMKSRRERLKHLAVKELTGDEIAFYGLEEKTVLDGNAAAVWCLLLRKGITVPQALSPVRRDSRRWNYTMYHQVYHVRQLEDLWTLGFRDINMLDDEGMPPLMNWRWDIHYEHHEPRCEWLINHGANMEEPVRRNGRVEIESQSITVCHNLIRLLGIRFLMHSRRSSYGPDRRIAEDFVEKLGSGQTVIKKLLTSTLDDYCGCKCLRGGCTPFIWLLKFLPVLGDRANSPWTHRVWPTDTRPERLADSIKVFTEAFSSNMSQNHLSEAVRCLTHAALGLKHTCCEAAVMRSPSMLNAFDPNNRRHMSAEEKEDLESEQASLIDLLDSLVAEFEEKSQEDRDGAPLWRADPAEFWVEVWASRMNGVIEGLDGANLTSEEIRAAENIGVEWKSPKPERPPSTKRPRHSLTFEEFEEEVDSIMRECR